ncbi:transposase, partial [Vibrio cholerae HC-50A1]
MIGRNGCCAASS